jgi:hypothetical protein
LRVNDSKAAARVEVTAEGKGVVGHAGSLLLAEVADRFGLTPAWSRVMAPMRRRRSVHDPGVVLVDLAVMLADGGDCLSDLSVLREQPELFGRVASGPTAWRVIESVEAAGLGMLRQARARARRQAWAAGAIPDEVVLDFDATLVTAHTEKEGAAPTWKRGFGFHPLLCYLDGSGEALAGILRPGNAGSNSASDHIQVLHMALAQLPAEAWQRPILVRADSGGATHGFVNALRARRLGFSIGFPLEEPVRQAILALPEEAWQPAMSQDGEERDGAAVAELWLDLSAWPQGTRAICRRERPHPGAQFSFSDHNGYRFQVFITDQTGGDLAALEARHRAHARVEDGIRCAKDTGLGNFPFRRFAPNQVWLELVLAAQDLIAWTQAICLTGELARCEPKRLRYRLLHVAAGIAHSGRRVILRLQRSWPWTYALAAAFARLRASPL